MPLAQGLSPPTCSWPKPSECSEELFEMSMAHTDSESRLCDNRISDLGSSKKRFMAPWHCPRTVPNESGSGAACGFRIYRYGYMTREKQLEEDEPRKQTRSAAADKVREPHDVGDLDKSDGNPENWLQWDHNSVG